VTPRSVKRLLLLALIAALIAAFFAFDLHRFLTLANLKASQARFTALYQQSPAAVLGAYFLFYILVVAANLPGATVMTLAGGALFGFLPALVAVSFASSIGATLACLLARYLLRDLVQARFGDKLARINAGIAREGAFYLFSIRLIPVFPFFVVNLLFGLTPMPLPTFYWVSQLGMLPATLVFINAGSQLGRLDSLAGILSPSLLASFAALGLFPLAAKKFLGWWRGRKAGTGR